MENIIWKPVVGYEGLYEVSNTGVVKSLGNGKTHKSIRILKQRMRSPKTTHLSVQLFKNGKRKQCRVHRLVAEAFIPNPDNLPIINHKDENPQNNNVGNLEWCDCKYNVLYSLNKHRDRYEGNKGNISFLIDKETGEMISPWTKKGMPHTCKKKVARVNESWEILELFDNPASAAKHFGVPVCNLITTCKKNQDRKYRYKTVGNIFIFVEE